MRRRIVVSGIWNFGDYAKEIDNRFGRAALSGWSFSAIFTGEAGRPYSAKVGADLNNDSNRFSDRVPGFARNAFTGPDYINMNFSLQKRFHLMAEGKMLTLRMEVYNLFNHSNFYNPISTYSTDGVTLNPDFGKIKSAHDPREFQFAIRFSW